MSAAPCAHRACPSLGTVRESDHSGRLPERIDLCPTHAAEWARIDACRAPGCDARASAWSLCDAHRHLRPGAPAIRLEPSEAEVAAVLRALDRPRPLSEIAREAGLIAGLARTALTRLRAEGRAVQDAGGLWTPTQTPPSQETPMPPTLKDRALAWIRASPGVRQADLPALIGSAQSQVSAALCALERDGLIERRRIEGRAALALWPVAAPTPLQVAEPIREEQAEDPAPAAPERLRPPDRAEAEAPPPLPAGEEPGGDCDGPELDEDETATDLERTRERITDLERDAQDRADAQEREIEQIREAIPEWAEGAGRLPAQIREVVRQAERRDPPEIACLQARIAKLEADAAEATQEHAEEIEGVWREIGGGPGGTPAEAIRLLVAELERQRDAGREEIERLKVQRDAAAPRWVETAPGSWDLQVLRPVTIATVDRASEAGFDWSLSDGSEAGSAISLERAQRRAEQALGEGAKEK